MAGITISDLSPAGSELFHDFESFLDELTERDILSVAGGLVIKDISINSNVTNVSIVSIISLNNTAGDIKTIGNTINANTVDNQNSIFKK